MTQEEANGLVEYVESDFSYWSESEGYYTPLAPTYIEGGSVEVGWPDADRILDVQLVGPVMEHHVWHGAYKRVSVRDYVGQRIDLSDEPQYDTALQAFVRSHQDLFPALVEQ
jgi:hypothetical protein